MATTQLNAVEQAKAKVGASRVQRQRILGAIGSHAVLVFATFIALFPCFWIVSASFKPKSEIDSSEISLFPKAPTLSNYSYTLFDNQNAIFWKWLLNSLIVAGLTAVLGVFLSATAAYAFSRFNFVGKKVGLMSFLVVQMFPLALLLLPIFNILNGLKLINTIPGLVLAYSTTAIPFCVWMMKGFFDTIPYELEEAAQIDGLGKLGTFWRIALPLSLPGISVVTFFSFMTAWNEFLLALVLMTGNENYTVSVGLRTFVDAYRANWGAYSAGATLVTIPVALLFLWAQRYLVSGLTSGGVKG